MNVSSVKNLNGEVLSAVQDAYLTNVVQTNSGNWKDITAYQNASATYLTEVSIPESATWNEVSTTVTTNSGVWGGSALPISAGKGVNLSVSDDKLVIRVVPTALYTVRISDIILTGSLPVSPEANTLYLIQE